MAILALSERDAEKKEKMRRSIKDLFSVLSEYAKDRGGNFIVFGSVAKKTFRSDSDIDILVDFDKKETDDAWKFAEQQCLSLGLSPDVRPKSMCSKEFLDGIKNSMETINGC
jgi:predicted nucleotidyltransferase